MYLRTRARVRVLHTCANFVLLVLIFDVYEGSTHLTSQNFPFFPGSCEQRPRISKNVQGKTIALHCENGSNVIALI